MLQLRLAVTAALYITFAVSEQVITLPPHRTIQFGHSGKAYRIVEPVEPIRTKRDTTSSNSSSSGYIFECYQYTWPGISENNTVPDCNDVRKTSPCYTPFVLTNDTSSPVPDPAIVKEYCDRVGCKVTCPKTSTNSCIRYAYYTGGMPQNITYFCGVVQDKTDDITLKEGAVSDTMSGGIEIYVKYCQANLCNAGNPLTNPFALTLLLFAAVVFLW